MKDLKILGFATVATMVLMGFVDCGTASATTLTGEGGAVLPAGSSIHATLDPSTGPSKLTTTFKTVECAKSTLEGTTENETSTSVDIAVKAFTLQECNCEFKALKGGILSIAWTEGSNGTLSWNGTEVTINCSTIFGNVHCIYVTENTTLGTLTGGTTGTIDIEGANIPRLQTSSLCAEGAKWDVKYSINSPDTLKVEN